MVGARSTGNIQKEARQAKALMWLRQMSKFHHQALFVRRFFGVKIKWYILHDELK